jgi:hypothetical protein
LEELFGEGALRETGYLRADHVDVDHRGANAGVEVDDQLFLNVGFDHHLFRQGGGRDHDDQRGRGRNRRGDLGGTKGGPLNDLVGQRAQAAP